MNEFDRRWQLCARHARQEATQPSPVPAGLATRVWARSVAGQHDSLSAAWAAMSFRMLVLATIALAICGLTEYYAAASESVWTPHLEDAVTAVWRTP